MVISDKRIDAGKPFDWGKASSDYAQYRDIYPEEFYRRIVGKGLCVAGQRILDLGTGTGVLPRNLYRFGGIWTGTDISPEQIEQARHLSESAGMEIAFQAVSAERLSFPEGSFDVITACQCFWYFDHEQVLPKLARMLRPGGKLVILYMAWLPSEDTIAGESEKLILKYSPDWSGAGEFRHPIAIPAVAYDFFELESHEEYDLMVPFSKKSWHGRIRASRGIGASLSEDKLAAWDAEHRELLDRIAPEHFDVKHYAAIAVLRKKDYLRNTN